MGEWKRGELGAQFAVATYNTYILPILSFTAQIAAPTKEVLDLEEWGLRRAMPGPGQWVDNEDLWAMGGHYGLPASFGSVSSLAKAAQLRVMYWENHTYGGLKIDNKCEQLEKLVRDPFVLSRVTLWANWLSQAIPRTLAKNANDLEELKINRSNIEKSIRKGEMRPWSEKTMRKVKRFFQREARSKLTEKTELRCAQ